MIYLIPHGHVIVSFLNRIIIVSRGACPSPDTLWGVGETDQIKSASRGHEIRKSACRCHFFSRSGSLIPRPTSLGGMADQIR